MAQEIKYEFSNACNYLFERMSNEVARRIKELRLQAKDIIVSRNTAGKHVAKVQAEEKEARSLRILLSRVKNNRRYAANKYLVTPIIIDPLKKGLLFNDVRELHWGDYSVTASYTQELFVQLATDILDDYLDKYPALHEALLDYVPYAKWSVYFELSLKYPDDVQYLLGYPQEELSANVLDARKQAIARLYEMKRPGETDDSFGDLFTDMFIGFTNEEDKKENEGFHKLDERIENFVAGELNELLESFKPSDQSFGKRTHMIMKDDLYKNMEHNLFVEERRTFEIQENYNISINEHDPTMLWQEVLIANQQYFEALEKAQKGLDHKWEFE